MNARQLALELVQLVGKHLAHERIDSSLVATAVGSEPNMRVLEMQIAIEPQPQHLLGGSRQLGTSIRQAVVPRRLVLTQQQGLGL